MKTLKFKTNINCSGCVARITPVLNTLEENALWNVDTSSKDKILEVQTTYATPIEIIEKLKQAGFRAEELS